MTDHLPECIAADPEAISGAMWCICDRLRACEQRVLDAAEAAVLDQAVRNLACCACNTDLESSLDAIRALKEKP